MLNFVDNWMRPVTLTAVQTSVAVDLPDGQYVLTVSDDAATRWEVVLVQVASGQADLMRENPQEWPEGSVIYCAANAMVLLTLFDSLDYVMEQVATGVPWQIVYGGSTVTLDKAGSYFRPTPSGGMVTIKPPADLPRLGRVQNTVEVQVFSGTVIRLSGEGLEIDFATVQDHPMITATIAPDNTYVDLTSSGTVKLKLVVAAYAAGYVENDAPLIRLQLTVDISDYDDYTTLS